MCHGIDVKNVFNVFYFCLKKHVFFIFLMSFLCFLNVVFLLFLKTKTYKITNMMHFSWAKCAKDSISWTERVFCSSIINFI